MDKKGFEAPIAKVEHKILLLPTLVIASFATGSMTALSSLLLVDIGNTFGTQVALTGQINTAYSVAALIFALTTSILSIQFKHKSLLLTGLLLTTASSLGCFFASDLITMTLFYSLSGAGIAMVSPLAVVMVAEHFPIKKRPNAIGCIIASKAMVYVIGLPIISVMSGVDGWHFPLLFFVTPMVAISLLVALCGLPTTVKNPPTHVDKTAILTSFKDVLTKKSTAACLTGDILLSAAFVAVYFFGISFIREQFQGSRDLGAVIFTGAMLCFVFGSLSSGLLVNSLGRKAATVLTAFFSGIFTLSYAIIPNLWFSVAAILVASCFFGMASSSANNLIVEQAPTARGTMMSLDYALINVGAAIGTIVGGMALLSFGYTALGIALGTMSIAAAAIFHRLAREPLATKP